MTDISNVISQDTIKTLQDLYTNGQITQDQFINMLKSLMTCK